MSWYLGDETQDGRLLGLWEYNILKIYLASKLYSMILLSKVVWDPLRNISTSAVLEYYKSLTVCQCMNFPEPRVCLGAYNFILSQRAREIMWLWTLSLPVLLSCYTGTWKHRKQILLKKCCMYAWPTWFMLRLADKTVHMCSAPLYVLSWVTSWYSSRDLVNMNHRHVLLLLGYHLKYSQQFSKFSTLLLMIALWCLIALGSVDSDPLSAAFTTPWPTADMLPCFHHGSLLCFHGFHFSPCVYRGCRSFPFLSLCDFTLYNAVQVHLHCHRPQNVLVYDTWYVCPTLSLPIHPVLDSLTQYVGCC